MSRVDIFFNKDILKSMVTQTVKIKNGSIALPERLRKFWKGAEVFITGEKDTLVIKKIVKPTLSQLRPKLKQLGKIITQKDIKKAILEVRRKEK